MTMEAQLRELAEASVAEQRPVTADEVFDSVADQHDTTNGRRTWWLVAATLVFLIGGLVALLALRDTTDDAPNPVLTVPTSVPTPTVPATGAPGTTVPTSAPTTTEPSPVASAPVGQEIRVSADAVEFGDGLVGRGQEGPIFLGPLAGLADIERLDGRTYVLAGTGAPRMEPRYVNTERAVLAAFDSTGSELWRTELDGRPADMAAAAGAVWVVRAGAQTLTQIDASDGHVIGEVHIADVAGMIGAYDALWLVTVDVSSDAIDPLEPVSLIRVDADLTTTAIELAADMPLVGRPLAVAGAGAIWVPMGVDGVVAIDPETLARTWISSAIIGHEARVVAVDGDAVYVASDHQITALVGGEVRATTAVAGSDLTWAYLGHVDGSFGYWASSPPEGFTVLRPSDPMVVEVRRLDSVPVGEIDGDGWAQTGPLSVGQVRVLPDVGDVPPAARWAGPVTDAGVEVYRMSAADGGDLSWQDPTDASEPWVDIQRVGFAAGNQTFWRIELALEPPPPSELEPGVVVAYGLVLDTNGDGAGDYLVGIDTDSPGPGDFHVWITDLQTGRTGENPGPSYGFPIEFGYPGEIDDGVGGVPPTMTFTFLPGSEPDGFDPASVRFYAWASVTRDGEVTAWDYAPDTGWISG